MYKWIFAVQTCVAQGSRVLLAEEPDHDWVTGSNMTYGVQTRSTLLLSPSHK